MIISSNIIFVFPFFGAKGKQTLFKKLISVILNLFSNFKITAVKTD
jgi:hypothetical protein